MAKRTSPITGKTTKTAATKSRASPTASQLRAAPHTDKNQLARQVLELRLAGCGYPEICQLLGLESNWAVWRMLQRAMKLAPREGSVLLLRLELFRLERLIRSLWRQAVQGDLPVLDRVLKLLAQRERLLRHWQRQEKQVQLPTLTLQQALAADRQLETWLQEHQPTPPAS